MFFSSINVFVVGTVKIKNHIFYLCFRNSLGYEMAEKFASKFTHVSPVWYDLKRYYWIFRCSVLTLPELVY